MPTFDLEVGTSGIDSTDVRGEPAPVAEAELVFVVGVDGMEEG
jgi:hypothetical protein